MADRTVVGHDERGAVIFNDGFRVTATNLGPNGVDEVREPTNDDGFGGGDAGGLGHGVHFGGQRR